MPQSKLWKTVPHSLSLGVLHQELFNTVIIAASRIDNHVHLPWVCWLMAVIQVLL